MGRDGSGVRPGSASSIEITFQYQGVRCRERIALKPTAANLKRAERHKIAIEEAIADGTFDYATTFPDSKNASRFAPPAHRIPLQHYVDDWLARVKPTVADSTYHGYEKDAAFVKRGLGSIPVVGITIPVLDNWFRTHAWRPKRAANIKLVIVQALQCAVHEEVIAENVARQFKPTIQKAKQRRSAQEIIDPFTVEEQRAILHELDRIHPQARAIFQFAFWTGLRPSEAVELYWSDVDLEANKLHVRRARTREALRAHDTKSEAGERVVDLLEPALEAIEIQKRYTSETGRHVFHDPRYDEPWRGHQELRVKFFQPACLAAKVRYRKPYQTRHTFASTLLRAGEDIAYVSRQLGHESIEMTIRHYARFMPHEGVDGRKVEALWREQLKGRFEANNDDKTPTRKHIIS